MASSEGPTIQGTILRQELIRLRLEAGLTQKQVADSLEWSSAKLIRIEGGRSSITKVDLDALLMQYGIVSDTRREQLHALNRAAHKHGWWTTYRHDIHETYLSYIGYEAGAAFIRQFSSTVLPGLLQTAQYARLFAINSADPRRVGPTVDLGLQRQSELAKRSAPPRQYHLLDEASLRRHVGSHEDLTIMPNQLRYIAERIEVDDLLTVRVIPFNAGAYAGMPNPFTLLEFDGQLPDRLYLSVGQETISVTDQDQVSQYADCFELLINSALPAEESVEFIRAVIGNMTNGDN